MVWVEECSVRGRGSRPKSYGFERFRHKKPVWSSPMVSPSTQVTSSSPADHPVEGENPRFSSVGSSSQCSSLGVEGLRRLSNHQSCNKPRALFLASSLLHPAQHINRPSSSLYLKDMRSSSNSSPPPSPLLHTTDINPTQPSSSSSSSSSSRSLPSAPTVSPQRLSPRTVFQ
jgi:hypothetical protein